MSTVPEPEADHCPNCGGVLKIRIEGFRPFTAEERSRLTPATIQTLDLCRNSACPSKIPAQRAARDFRLT